MPELYKSIHGWFDWEDLYNEMVDRFHDNGYFIEIGCYKGKSGTYLAELILEKNANIYVDYIDPWEKEISNSDLEEDKYRSIESIYEEFLANLNKVTNGDDRFKVIRNQSQLEAKYYLDNSLDFVFVDGNHDPEPFMQDVKLYLPKIKKRGVIAGHDVNGPDVKEGLDILRQEGFEWYNSPPSSWRYNVI